MIVLRAVLTNSPNSIPPERVFSILKRTFGDQQEASLRDYMSLSMRRQYKKNATSVAGRRVRRK